MDLYEAMQKRRTVRDFSDRPVPGDAVERILRAGLTAPSNDHLRDWQFVVLDDREAIAGALAKVPKKVSAARVEFLLDGWKIEDPLQRSMYRDAIPKQHAMLTRSGCLILPFFRQRAPLLKPRGLSALNGLASVWCCIENMLLAATAEGLCCAFRIPLSDEAEHTAAAVRAPKEYALPCYLAVGYPAEDAAPCEQLPCALADRLHKNAWSPEGMGKGGA